MQGNDQSYFIRCPQQADRLACACDCIFQKFGNVDLAEMLAGSVRASPGDIVKFVCNDKTLVCTFGTGVPGSIKTSLLFHAAITVFEGLVNQHCQVYLFKEAIAHYFLRP